MSLKNTSPDLGRISIYDLNINDIELSSADLQLKKHTDYDDEHLKRLKCLFQQLTGPEMDTLNLDQFESAARSLCQALTTSSKAHHLAEILFRAYDKNSNNQIDFDEMIEFVWTVIDAPREEQIAGLYQAFQEQDFQPKISNENHGQMKALKTDDDIRNRTDECFAFYRNPSDGLNVSQIIDYFLGTKDSLGREVKNRFNARLDRRKKKRTNLQSAD